MGQCCNRGFSSYACVTDINSSVETVWTTLLDIESAPLYSSSLVSVSNIQHRNTDNVDDIRFEDEYNLNSFEATRTDSTHTKSMIVLLKEGTSWDEIRTYYGQEELLRKTVTDMSPMKSFRCNGRENERDNINTSLFLRIHVVMPKVQRTNAVNTISLLVTTVHNRSVDTCCQLQGTTCFLPPTIGGILHLWPRFFGKLPKRDEIQRLLQQELNEIALEAERRQQKQQQQQKEHQSAIFDAKS